MKTSEQVAADIVYQNGGDGPHALKNIIAAIEADRAQRISDDDIQILADAADYWAAELIDYIIPDADKSERPEWQEQVDSIQAALARYLALKGE